MADAPSRGGKPGASNTIALSGDEPKKERLRLTSGLQMTAAPIMRSASVWLCLCTSDALILQYLDHGDSQPALPADDGIQSSVTP
jgi:hypothetical protein